MTQDLYTASDIWLGGYFELAIEIGATSDDRLFMTLQTIWSYSELEGCYKLRNTEPHNQQTVQPTRDRIRSGYHLLGVAKLPNGDRVACGTCSVRETCGIDWLTLYIPMGALGTSYDVEAYPFIDDISEHIDWINIIEKWLSEIGQYVYKTINFKLGLIGFEVSGVTYSSDIREKGIPEKRRIGYLWAKNGQLAYYPCNLE